MTEPNTETLPSLFTLELKPNSDPVEVRKKTTVFLYWVTKPFVVEQQEGRKRIDETLEGWDGGYFVAYPSDGSKPYPISRSFVNENYIEEV